MPRSFEKPELLAPAGGFEQLFYAVHFGADAVYLASERFGMRQRASNFKLADLPRVVDFAHAHGVSVHVACNIVMHEDDIAELPAYFYALENAGADAVIIGDIGALRVLSQTGCALDVHVSTQASVANAQAALMWHELGAKRIVCAREMSLDGIARMRAELPDDLELEAFVHGAMCMAYSGRCLISDYLTGRSALSGHCTQSCRWSYTLEEAKRPDEHFGIEQDGHGSYLLNAEDLNMIAHLDALRDAGVSSFKIEGRNKKAFYVASVVNAYRQALDGADIDTMAAELETISHRPYSTGFYFGPAHQADTTDERLWACEWAAEVLSCEKLPEGAYRAHIRCRNAFCKDTPLEVIAPRKAPQKLKIRALSHCPEDAPAGTRIAVELANRAMETYSFECDVELSAHDVIRMPKKH